MTKERFIHKTFTAAHLAVIDQANEIITDYQRQGFTLTLRQLYYQFVSRALIPNKQTEYKRLGSIVNEARLAGYIDWAAVEDRTRNVRGGDWGYDSPENAMLSLAEGYAEEFWIRQPNHVEVWIEKDALIGVIEPVCGRWRLPYLACRGYISQSEQYAAGKRFARERHLGRNPVVLYLGDHDPSGIDMTRDHVDRLAMFARFGVDVRRLALNMAQVEQYDPPPNPAKETDSRSGKELEDGGFTPGSYRDVYGESSWELDALEPTVIDQLIEDEVKGLVDHDAWAASEAKQEQNRKVLTAMSDHYRHLENHLIDQGLLGEDEEPEE